MKINFLLLLLIAAARLTAQTLSGTVSEKPPGGALPGAAVFWKGTHTGTAADENGRFTLAYPDSFPAVLYVQLLGYEADSIRFKAITNTPVTITLKAMASKVSDTVEVVYKMDDFTFSSRPINTEIITQRGLLKAACCNLSESFETNPSVDAAVSDAVSGTKKIQMLGLDGVYTQLLNENLPLIRGLSAAYGIGQVPGTWIKAILITKGTGSVVNGYESISGQINLDLLKPEELNEKQERFFINVYGNHQGRAEANAHAAYMLNDKVGTLLLAHYSQLQVRNDMNNDGFLNMPLYRQVNVMNRWTWNNGKNIEGQTGFRVIDETRQGGQTSFDYARDFGTQQAYGFGIGTKQYEFFNKTGFIFSKPGTSIGTMLSSRYHKQNMYFGQRSYNGEQRSVYANILFQTYINNTNHTFKTGTSFILDDYRENFMDSAFGRQEIVPGAFVEYTGQVTPRFSVVAGLRGDLHNRWGFFATPRLHMKYAVTEHLSVRASGGRGFRTSNVFVEQFGLFASSRKITVTETLRPEVAWNYGGSVTWNFKLLKKEAALNADFFRTDFTNQVVVDFEQPRELLFYNLQGKSFANSAQADFSITPVERLDLRAAYKWYDVQVTYRDGLKQRPLQAQHRMLFNAAYALPFDRWKFDATAKWFGNARVPVASANPALNNVPASSPAYWIFQAQVTKKFRWFDLYAGCENISNYMQKNPIIDPANPFGADFDATLIYAPIDGRLIYFGIRKSFN